MKETEKPNIPVTRSSMPPFEEYIEEIHSLWDSHWLTNCGVKHQQLQSKLQEYLKVKHVEMFVNGHSAIEAILEAFNIQGEVITTSFTFVSTTNAIVRRGATPVFVDVEPEWLTIDPKKIEAAITSKTEAILAVHVYGNLCEIDEIQSIASKHGLKVIYDAAHAFGVTKNNVGALSFGDASAVSFHATKAFNTIEGGAACTSNSSLAQVMARNRNFGLDISGNCVEPGGNAKMNEFCAAMGLCNLRHVDEEIAKRKAAYDEYVDQLQGVPGVCLLKDQPGVKRNYAYMPVLIDPEKFGATRDDVFEALEREGVHTRKYFYPAINEMGWYKNRFVSDTPIASRAAKNVITLPLYADLSIENARQVSSIVKDAKNA